MSSYIDFLDVHYSIKGLKVLKDIQLKLEQHQFTALVGPNGSGKTTLGKLIMGIIKPTMGTINVDNRPIKSYSLSEIGGEIGYLFQNPSRQIFAPTVIEELSFAFQYQDLPAIEVEQRVVQIMDSLELSHLRDAKSYFLSQGEKQRLAIAAILLNNPSYLILDEPTTGLDSKRKQQLSELLQTVRSRNIGVLLISHDDKFIKDHAERIITLKEGRIINDED